MTNSVMKYFPGEMSCVGCAMPLPAVETWPGHRVLYCDRPSCKIKAAAHPYMQYVEVGQIQCKRSGCEKYVPAGCYDQRHTSWACSADCWRRLQSEKNRIDTLVPCDCGCGELIQPWNTAGGRHFKNREHAGRFRTEQALARCGNFQPLIREYLDGFARIHYARSSRGTALTSLVAFCEFLVAKEIRNMNDVGPRTITEYLCWGEDTGRSQVAHSPSCLSVFFNWQIAEGRRTLGNPVIPAIHKVRRNSLDPRPLSSEEVDLAWKLIDERGDHQLRLAMALGLESGLRISELANVRLDDVDQVKQRIYVRTPNKTKKPRFAPYGEKAKQYLGEWLGVRDPHCGHDHLFYNKFHFPATAQALRLAFTSALTKLGKNYYYGDQTLNVEGFDNWSTHRLRHTMSSNLVNGGADASTVMAVGGWSTFKAMCGYSKVDESVAQRGYDEAMKRSKEQRREKRETKRLSLAELVKQKKANAK